MSRVITVSHLIFSDHFSTMSHVITVAHLIILVRHLIAGVLERDGPWFTRDHRDTFGPLELLVGAVMHLSTVTLLMTSKLLITVAHFVT